MKHRLQDQTRTQNEGNLLDTTLAQTGVFLKKIPNWLEKVDVLQFQFPRRCLFINYCKIIGYITMPKI
jgi:hypothetical protein